MRPSIHLLLSFVLGCSAIEDGDSPARLRLGSAPPGPSVVAVPDPPWLAFDTLDRPVVFDPTTGAVVASGPALAAVERDITYDPWTGDVAVFTSPEGEGGVVQHLSWPSLSPTGEPFAIDGRVELWFGPEGLWLFEQSYGERWRRIRRDEQWEPSWPLRPPSSLWSRDSPAFGALVDDGGQATLLGIDPTASAVPSTATPLPGIVPSVGAARATPLPDGVAIAWTVAGGIQICVLDDEGAVVHDRALGLPGVVRQAATLTTPRGPWIALALEAQPTQVVALDPYGEALSQPFELDGSLDPDEHVDRRLSAEGSRLLVATSQGVSALILEVGSATLSRDEAFVGDQLRGPLATRRTHVLP